MFCGVHVARRRFGPIPRALGLHPQFDRRAVRAKITALTWVAELVSSRGRTACSARVAATTRARRRGRQPGRRLGRGGGVLRRR
eukprot:2818621-Pyramimonas_sp.AAC.1